MRAPRLLTIAVLLLHSVATNAYSAEKTVPFEFILTKEQFAALPSDLQPGITSIRKPETEEVATAIIIIAGAVAVSILADTIADFVWEMTANGVVVDLRGGKVSIEESPSLSAKQILIVSDTEVRTVEVNKRDDLPEILKAIVPGE